MIVISMLLVIVGFVTLVLGVLGIGIADVEPLTFVYASIAACILAGAFLAVGVVRGRPSHKPVSASDAEGQTASWSGASAWQQPERLPPPESRVDRQGQDRHDPPAVAQADIEARLRAVSGVGPAKQQALLEHFGSHAALAAASVEDIAAVRGVSETLARRIHEALRA